MDLKTYLSAWNKYLKVMVYYHPQLTPELLNYQKRIFNYTFRYPITDIIYLIMCSGIRFKMIQACNGMICFWIGFIHAFLGLQPHQYNALLASVLGISLMHANIRVSSPKRFNKASSQSSPADEVYTHNAHSNLLR